VGKSRRCSLVKRNEIVIGYKEKNGYKEQNCHPRGCLVMNHTSCRFDVFAHFTTFFVQAALSFINDVCALSQLATLSTVTDANVTPK